MRRSTETHTLGDIISRRKAWVKVCLLLSGAGHLLPQDTEKLRYWICPFLRTYSRTGIFRRVNLVIAYKCLKGGCEKDSQALFSSVPQSYKRLWSQTETHKILLKRENHFFTVRVTELLNSLSSEVVPSPSLAILRSCLDMTLTNWYLVQSILHWILDKYYN